MAEYSTPASKGYPSPVKFEGHYSIFVLAFKHGVTWQMFSSEKQRLDYGKTLFDIGWRPHPGVLDPKKRTDRAFSPEFIFSPQASQSAMGTSRFISDEVNAASLADHIGQRLNPNKLDAKFSEPLILTLESPSWLKQPLQCRKEIHDRNGNISNNTFEFEMDWIDLWLLSDSTGFIAFKAKQLGECSISTLSAMNLTLRDHCSENIYVCPVAKKDDERLLWNDLIISNWLGFESNSSLFSTVLLNQNISDSRIKEPHDVFDQFQRYCKTLVFAQTPDIAEEQSLAWDRPLSDPMIHYNQKQAQMVKDGDWDLTLTASQNAIIAGYASVRDMVCFELATFSEEGGAIGWNGKPGWQYSVEYIKNLMNQQSIEIWEHWIGLVLRDTCVFVSYDQSMPIHWQAEARYYPLYLFTYHLRFRLDQLSQQAIDHDMADAKRGYKLRDDFQRFRNHYCFHETTTDFMGDVVFDKMIKSLEVPGALETVKTEIDEVSQHIREKWDMVTRSLIAAWIVITTLTSFDSGKYLLGILLLLLATMGFTFYKHPQHPVIHKTTAFLNGIYSTIVKWMGKI